MTLDAGTRLGPYEIVAPLGAGGMGTIYRSRDTRLGREVAVKVLSDELARDPDLLRRFETEARAASALNHPAILTVHDFGVHDGAPYLVTELLEGESLRQTLSRGPLPPSRALDFAAQVARGLAAAHDKGIVHRDLKPENLFVTEDGRMKILDFGLARMSQRSRPAPHEASSSVATEAGMILGTAGYMAPEQVLGEAADARSDLFSFGCVLYEMLTGRRAFTGESSIDLMHAIVRSEPPEMAPPGTPPLPAALEGMVRHCLDKQPGNRFQSARDLLFALDYARAELGDAGGTTETPPPISTAPTQVTEPPARRRPRVAAVVAAAVGVVLVALAAWLVFGPASRPVERQALDSLAVLPLVNLSGDPQQEYFADGMTEALIAELAKLRALKVISRTSVMHYKNGRSSLPAIARELGVRGIIEGSVLRAGEQVRITVQLIDAAEDRHLWAESYTRAASDVLGLQSEVARAIAREVRIAVSPAEERALATDQVVDPEAHRLVLQARDLIRRGSTQLEEQKRISELLDRALELDPDYAAAHVLRGSQLSALAFTGYQSGTDACPPARSELAQALALDARSIEARGLDATLRLACDYDWEGALATYAEALDEAPGDASLHDGYGRVLSLVGRHDEAIAEAKRAFELDPLNDWLAGNLVASLVQARRFREAIEFGRQQLAVAPGSVYLKWQLGNAQTADGDHTGALSTYLSREVAHPDMNFMVGLAQARLGRQADARRVLDFLLERRRQRYVPGSMIALVYGGLGESDAAFEWLDRAAAEHDYFLQTLLVDPVFDMLRPDPRFRRVLEAVKLAPAA